MYYITFPTAASPSKTSFTLLLGFGAAEVVSAILCHTFKSPAQKRFASYDDEGSQEGRLGQNSQVKGG
jgi:hypothetical protein